MLGSILIIPSNSEWSYVVVLERKDKNSRCLCFDWRKVNHMTKTNSYLIPRIKDCINQMGNDKHIIKFYMLKGYWQVGLTERAKDISAFITPDGLCSCNVMPIGMKNAASIFQWLMNKVTSDLEDRVIYIDDDIKFSDTWEEHLQRMQTFLARVKESRLLMNNLNKCLFRYILFFIFAAENYLGL